jgi:hypothetical protein
MISSRKLWRMGTAVTMCAIDDVIGFGEHLDIMKRLFHLTSAEIALEDLRWKRLKIAEIQDLNDVFELFAVSLIDPRFDCAFRSAKDHQARRHGVLCFCADWGDPLLWGHYADRARGVCFGFDVPESDDRVFPVKYVKTRQECPTDLDAPFVETFLRTKYEGWGYENEWRVWVDLTDPLWSPSLERNLYFWKFGDGLELREVILGPRCTLKACEIREAFGESADGVRILKTTLHRTEFKIIHESSKE